MNAAEHPKLDFVSHSEGRHICLDRLMTADRIENCLKEIVHTHFHDQLTIRQFKSDPNETKWIIKARDTEYIYGFSILYDNKRQKLFAGHPVNTVSIWMQELTQETLAKKFGLKIVISESEKRVEPNPEAIDTFREWLYLRAKGEPTDKIQGYYDYQSARLPDGLLQFEGRPSSTH